MERRSGSFIKQPSRRFYVGHRQITEGQSYGYRKKFGGLKNVLSD